MSFSKRSPRLGLPFSSGWVIRRPNLRTLFYSYFAHAGVILSIFMLPPSFWLVHGGADMETIALSDVRQHEILLLPALGGGSEGQKGGHDGSGGNSKRGSAGSGGGRPAGMVYKGPQPIVSNPSKADNFVQTIQQPDLLKPPTLKFPVPAPNIVLMAARHGPELIKPSVTPPTVPLVTQSKLRHAPTAGLPVEVIQPPPAVDSPRLPLPPTGIDAAAVQPTVAQPPAAPPVPTSPTSQSRSAEAYGTDDRNLLVLNAISLSLKDRGINIPPGEASGAFTVAPDPSALSGEGGGIGTGGGPGTGSGKGVGSGSGGGAGGTGTGSGSGHGPGGNGTGTGTGSGSGSGSGSGTGSGPGGGGSGSGSGSGTGRGSGSGPGSGSGSGPGGGPFRDISIHGGSATRVGGGRGGASPSIPSRQYGYGMTVIASGASGGGLRDFGLFRNEAVYTVFIEPDEQMGGSQWVLQYAYGNDPAGAARAPAPARGVLTPPYPISRQSPQFPAEIVARNAGRMLVVYGVINPEGKLQSMRIVQSPNPLLNQPLLDAMANWLFKAAELNGEAISVRILIGVPLGAAAQ